MFLESIRKKKHLNKYSLLLYKISVFNTDLSDIKKHVKSPWVFRSVPGYCSEPFWQCLHWSKNRSTLYSRSPSLQTPHLKINSALLSVINQKHFFMHKQKERWWLTHWDIWLVWTKSICSGFRLFDRFGWGCRSFGRLLALLRHTSRGWNRWRLGRRNIDVTLNLLLNAER